MLILVARIDFKRVQYYFSNFLFNNLNFCWRLLMSSSTFSLLLLFIIFHLSFSCPYVTHWNQYTLMCEQCQSDCMRCVQSTSCLKQNLQTYSPSLDSKSSSINIRSERILVQCINNCDVCNVSNFCIQCSFGYGPNNNQNQCRPCHNQCQTCYEENNLSACITCPPGRYYDNSTNRCKNCGPDFSNICLQCIQSSCTLCQSGYFVDNVGRCSQCLLLQCTTCANSSFCIACNAGYTSLNGICVDLCGDSNLITLDCDNPLGILFDGCNDTCHQMEDFNCYSSPTNYCTYFGNLTMNFIEMVKIEDKNQLNLILDIYPPLYAFRDTNLQSLFSLNDSDLTISKIQYSNGRLNILISYSTTVVGRNFQVIFNPSQSSDIRFTETPNSKMSMSIPSSIPAYFYPAEIYALANSAYYIFIVLLVLTWIAFLLGIPSVKLAGLQLLFVLQCIWTTFLNFPGKLTLIYKQLIIFKYSFGFSIYLESLQTTESANIQFINFYFDSNKLSNNLNLILLLMLIPVIGLVVCKLLSWSQKYKQSARSKYQLFLQLTFYGVLSILVPFVASTVIHFYSSNSLGHIGSIIIACICGITTLVICIKFYFDPDPFSRFRYSFRASQLAMNHYFLHILNILAFLVLLVCLPQAPWACLIAPALLMIYTFIFRPYRQLSENLRSGYYLFVVVIGDVLRMVYKNESIEWKFGTQTPTILLLVLLFGLYLLAVIWAYIQIIRSFCEDNKKKKDQEKKNKQFALFQDTKFLNEIWNPANLHYLDTKNILNTSKDREQGQKGYKEEMTEIEPQEEILGQKFNQNFRKKGQSRQSSQNIHNVGNEKMLAKDLLRNQMLNKDQSQSCKREGQLNNQQKRVEKPSKYEQKTVSQRQNQQQNQQVQKVKKDGFKGQLYKKQDQEKLPRDRLAVEQKDVEIAVKAGENIKQKKKELEVPKPFKISKKSIFKDYVEERKLPIKIQQPLIMQQDQKDTIHKNGQVPQQNKMETLSPEKKSEIQKMVKSELLFFKLKKSEAYIRQADKELINIYDQI